MKAMSNLCTEVFELPANIQNIIPVYLHLQRLLVNYDGSENLE